eukprot:1172460-Prorocentrum_minimum.AAC.11
MQHSTVDSRLFPWKKSHLSLLFTSATRRQLGVEARDGLRKIWVNTQVVPPLEILVLDEGKGDQDDDEMSSLMYSLICRGVELTVGLAMYSK